MGIFTKKEKTKDVTPPVARTARSQLEQFIKGQPFGTSPNIPTRGIAGQSDLQQELMRLLGGQVTGDDFGITQDVFRQAAQRDVDVASSPEFEGLRRQIERLGTEAQTDVRQRGELAGQLKSTPTAAIEADTAQQFDTFLLQEFSRLQRQAEQDKLAAASGLAELGTRRIGDIGAATKIADQERAIEQARNDAIYNQSLQTVMFPYQEQLQLFAMLQGIQPNLIQTGGGLTDLGFAASVVSSAIGGGSGGVSPSSSARSSGVSPAGAATATGRTPSGGFRFG
jgi:hypothetical protein